MKLVKSLLLGSAAGFVAIAGAQAADLPVKARPVAYVKICSLYGVGFYYIPGTDTCIKLGGWVRAEYNYQAHGSFNPIVNGGDARFNRGSADDDWRARGELSLDVRSQTEYGTLRSYIFGGFQHDSSGNGANVVNIYSNRAFVQLAGFTAGLASSFFDFYVTPWYSNTTNILGSDSTGGGQMVFAYTAEFGNGFSATLAAEDPYSRDTAIWRAATIGPVLTTATPLTALGGTTNDWNKTQWPDVVGNLRIDQAWGSAQIMGAIHDVNADYYGATEGTGHPSDAIGFAVGGGVKVNIPWAKGDSFAAQATYTQGALKYVGSGIGGFSIYDGRNWGIGWATDAVYCSPLTAPGACAGKTDLELTEAWSIVAGIDHHWDAHWDTSLYGTYGAFHYNSAATNQLNFLLCGTTACTGHNPDFQFWQIGSRTVWTPVENLALSVDVMYNELDTSYGGLNANLAPGGFKPAGVYKISDEGVWQAIFRVQRDFWP
jgi:Porin subfamily